FLNSPFFDLNAPWLLREVGTPVTVRLGKVQPKLKLPFALNTVYGDTIHSSRKGSWSYDLEWKPLEGFPGYAGWLRAIRAGQRRLHAGLAIDAPILVCSSTASYKGTKWHEDARSADSILDVDHMARWSPRLGRLVTLARIEGGLHDLTLSSEGART